MPVVILPGVTEKQDHPTTTIELMWYV